MKNFLNIFIVFLFISQLSFSADEKIRCQRDENFLVLCFSDHIYCHKKKCQEINEYYWVSNLDSFMRNEEIYPFLCHEDYVAGCALCDGTYFPLDLNPNRIELPYADSTLIRQDNFYSQFQEQKKLLQTIKIECTYGRQGFIEVYYAIFNGVLDCCIPCDENDYSGPIYVFGQNSHLDYDSSFNFDSSKEYKLWNRYNFVEFRKHLGGRNYVHTR